MICYATASVSRHFPDGTFSTLLRYTHREVNVDAFPAK